MTNSRTEQGRSVLFLFVVVTAAVLTLAIRAKACPVCISIGEPLTLPHPHALQIAVATRKAFEQGHLPANSTQVREKNPLYADVVRFANQGLDLQKPVPDRTILVDLLIADEPAIYRIEFSPGQVKVSPLNENDLRKCGARLITTTPVVRSIGRMDIEFGKAKRLGVLEIEGDESIFQESTR